MHCAPYFSHCGSFVARFNAANPSHAHIIQRLPLNHCPCQSSLIIENGFLPHEMYCSMSSHLPVGMISLCIYEAIFFAPCRYSVRFVALYISARNHKPAAGCALSYMMSDVFMSSVTYDG